MKRSFWLCVLGALSLAGCLDLDHEFTLNPDGSGKVKLRCVTTPMNFNPGEKRTPEEMLNSEVSDTLSKSAGVDAWTGVSASVRDDGKYSFAGTAYFKNIENLKLHVLGVDSKGQELIFRREKDGAISVEMGLDSGGDAKPTAPATPPSEEEIKAKMKEQRAKFQQSRAMMEAFLKDLKVHSVIHLPGPVVEVHNFKKLGPSTVELILDGGKALKVMGDLMMDDAYLRKMILEGRDLNGAGPGSDKAFMEKMFGESGPIRAVARGPLKPSFNYEAEAVPARAAYAELQKKYAVGPAPAGPRPAAAGAGFTSVRVTGVQFVLASDHSRRISPFNHRDPGLTLALVAELSGAALAAKEGEVRVAMADSGESLLPKSDFSRHISFPHLTDDKKAILFEVELEMPGPKATGIREVSGMLRYIVADRTKEVDLGLSGLATGARGKALGAEILKVGESSFQKDHQELELKLRIAKDAVESVQFFDPSGAKIEASENGYSSSGDVTTLTFDRKGAFPATGRIVARVYDDPRTLEAPFKVTGTDLLGRPQK